MYTSWSSANQISNFKFSAFFRVLFALWSLKYPHPKSQQPPRVSTELGMVVNFSYSLIPLQKKFHRKVSIAQLKTQRSAQKISKWRRTRRSNFSDACAIKCPLLTRPSRPMLSLSQVFAGKDAILKHIFTGFKDSSERFRKRLSQICLEGMYVFTKSQSGEGAYIMLCRHLGTIFTAFRDSS